MENYTKYKLKSSDELASVLNGRDNLFVIACNKCFKEFETVDEPDCKEFLKFAAEQGKTVTGSAKFDFLLRPFLDNKRVTSEFLLSVFQMSNTAHPNIRFYRSHNHSFDKMRWRSYFPEMPI